MGILGDPSVAPQTQGGVGTIQPVPDLRPPFFGMKTLCAAVCLLAPAAADCYLHNPRGSNNKLSEENDNTQNQQRLFDSQNNAAGGYQIGDNCVPACHEAEGNTNYDQNVQGAMKGQMQ